MSLHKLNQMVSKAAKVIIDTEKFPTEVLAVRARKVAEAYPSDPTAVAMCNFLTERAHSEMLISRGELREVYHKLFSQNNHFGSNFVEELGLAELPKKTKVMHREANEGKSLTQEAYENLADPVLSNALSQVFDPKGTYQPYSISLAKSAMRTCLHELNKFVSPKKIEVVAGQADLLLCQATYETPKGWCSVLVPVEIKEGAILLPTVFLSKLGFVDLNQSTLEQYIVETAGKKFSVDVQQLLQVIASAKNHGIKPLSDMEMIIAKARAAKNESTYVLNGILHQTVDQPQSNITVQDLPEAQEFAKRLASTAGIAEFKFGKTVVERSRQIVKQALQEFGYPHAHISVADVDDHTLYFAVSMDNRGACKIPMKIAANNCINYPKFIVSAGKIYDFSKLGLSTVLNEQDVDHQALALASPAYGLKINELIEQVQNSMVEGNLTRAEDALVVLQQSNVNAFKEALAIYQAGLSGKIKVASAQESICAKQRKVAYSKYIICGHTNLPVHKVYQDHNGDCQPLYRKNIAAAEGGSFLHSKVYFG